MGTRCANHVTPLYPQKLALTSPTGGDRSVGMVRSRTKATEFSFFFLYQCTANTDRKFCPGDQSKQPYVCDLAHRVPQNLYSVSLSFLRAFSVSNLRHVLNLLFFLLINSLASELYMPTFRITLPLPSS